MTDPIYDDPRLARLYDPLDPDRSDLEAYAALVVELGGGAVLDVGCGTGTFACLLAGRGHEVVGVDPSAASLEVARAKPLAERVTWVLGDATTLPPLQVDVATMTANVAQVFLTDASWAATLDGVRASLRPGGHLVFETRVPEREAWRGWTPEETRTVVDVPGNGRVEAWCEVLDVTGDLVRFRWTHLLGEERTAVVSDSVLRFRGRAELERSLTAHSFIVDDMRDAPDRPGRELVVVASRAGPV